MIVAKDRLRGNMRRKWRLLYSPAKVRIATELLKRCDSVMKETSEWYLKEPEYWRLQRLELSTAKVLKSEERRIALVKLSIESQRRLKEDIPSLSSLIADFTELIDRFDCLFER
jgi:hypothetical protein